MSTKIYYAYRFHRSKLEHFLEFARNLVFTRATVRMEQLMDTVGDELARTVPAGIADDERIDNEKWLDEGGERFNRLSKAFELPIVASRKGVRGFNLDSWMNLWPNGDYWYVIPEWPDGSGIDREKDLPDYVEEYGYWDNVDQPEGVTDAEWDLRANKWKEICIDDHDRSRLSHTIIEAKCYTLVGLHEIERRIKESGPWPETKKTGFGAAYRASYWVDVNEREAKEKKDVESKSEEPEGEDLG